MAKFIDNMKAFFNNYDDEEYVSSYIDDEEMEEEESFEEFAEVEEAPVKPVFQNIQAKKQKVKEDNTSTVKTKANQEEKVLDFSRLSTQQVVVVKPEAIEDGQVIANSLRAGNVVLCNFEDLDQRRAQRIIDFLSGAAFSLGGKVMPISSLIFIITPIHVNLQEGLEEKEELHSMENIRKVVGALR